MLGVFTRALASPGAFGRGLHIPFNGLDSDASLVLRSILAHIVVAFSCSSGRDHHVFTGSQVSSLDCFGGEGCVTNPMADSYRGVDGGVEIDSGGA